MSLVFILFREEDERTQKHILGKDIHAIYSLRAKTVCQRVISVEVLLQGST